MGIQRNTIYRAGAYSVAVCILLALSTLFLLQHIINLTSVKARISTEIQNYSGLELRQDKIEFILYPLPGIRFNEIKLYIDHRFSLSVDQAEIHLDFLQLINRKIVPKRIDIQGPELHVAPKTTLSDVPKKTVESDNKANTKLKPKPPSSYFAAQFFQDAARRVYAMFPDSRNDLDITLSQGRSEYFSGLNATCRISADKKGMSLTGGITDINLQRGQLPEVDNATAGILKYFTAHRFDLSLNLSSSGILSGQLDLDQPEARLSGLTEKISVPGTIQSKIYLSDESIAVAIGPGQFKTPAGEVGAELNYRPDSGETRLIFKGQNVDIAQARDICLPLLGGNNVVDILFDILRAGKTEDIMVGFEAPSPDQLFDGNNLIIEGGARSAQVKIPEVPLVVKQVDGRATMNNGVLHIDAGKGKIQGANILGGTLDVDIVNHANVPFSGEFSIEADLAYLPGTLTRLLPDTDLAKELTRVSSITGDVKGVLKLNMPAGAKELEVRVDTEPLNAIGRYTPIPLPLSITAGTFHLEPKKVILSNISGKLGTNPVQIQRGEVSLSPPFQLKIKGGSAQVLTDDLMPWAKAHSSVMNALFPATSLAGPINLDSIDMQGAMFSPEKWTYKLKGNTHDLNIGFRQKDFSVTGLSGTLYFSQKSFLVNELNGLVQDLSWLNSHNSGNYTDIFSAIKLPLALSQGSYKETEADCFFKGSLTSLDGPVVTINLSGNSPKTLTPDMIELEEAGLTKLQAIAHTSPNHPSMEVKGTFNTLTLEKMLVQGSKLQQKLHAVTNGSPLTIFTDQAQLHINAQYLNLDTLLPETIKLREKENSRSASGIQAVEQKPNQPLIGQKAIVLKSKALVIKSKKFTGVDSRLQFDTGNTKISIRNAEICGLKTHGHIDITKGKENITEAATQFIIQSREEGEDASTLFSCLLGAKSIIEGRCKFTGEFIGHDTTALIARRQNGVISFSAENGRIYKATLLSRVLSGLNILGNTDISQHGFGYKTMTVDAEVKDSVIHIKKAYIDADDMAIITSGWVDPFNDRLELTFLVAPFKTIDTIIQYIPLVNTILSGRLVSFPAKATGSLSDPTVIPLHPSAVGTGLITLFGDLIKAPVRIFKGNKKNE